MKNDDTRIDKFYDGVETRRANGLLYMIFLWLVAFNPILIMLTAFPVNDFLAAYLPQFGQEWYFQARPAIIALVVFLAFAGIGLGIGINLLKKTAWRLFKIYLPFLQTVYLGLLIPAFLLLEGGRKDGFFATRPDKYESYMASFTTMLIASSIIFILLFLYALRSKKARETFQPEKRILHRNDIIKEDSN